MKVIVPLAGPDLDHPVYGLKPLHQIEGRPLLDKALHSRPWMQTGEVAPGDLTFVVRAGRELGRLASHLHDHYPGARLVQLSDLTGGALLSSLAGAALGGRGDEPLCIDLADIIYAWPDYDAASLWTRGVGAVAPVFAATDPAFSYLRRQDGEVVEAAEKRVISAEASAGTYLFADLAVFLSAAAHSVRHAGHLAHKGALFVCPMVNGVLADGLSVVAPQVRDVQVVSRLFHAGGEVSE